MNGLFRLEAFGWSPWNLWRITQGGLDEPELERATERHHLYEDDFGSIDDLRLALRIFPATLDDLDTERSKRIWKRTVDRTER